MSRLLTHKFKTRGPNLHSLSDKRPISKALSTRKSINPYEYSINFLFETKLNLVNLLILC